LGGGGVGTGGTLRGLAIGGIGVGAPRVEGVILSGAAAGGEDVRWLSIAPAYFRIDGPGGRFTGATVAAFNHIKGTQRGLAIGVFNYATELRGVQIGVLNWAGNNQGARRLLPVVNWH
jgi:hypothetical protein